MRASTKKTKLGYKPVIIISPDISYTIDIPYVYRKNAIEFAQREIEDATKTGVISWN